jgi:transcriptional regulator with XRE-family HTH domain
VSSDVPSLRQRWLGAKLAELRQRAGLNSLTAAAEKAGRSTASLSRIENGIVFLPPRDVPPLLDAYDVADQRSRERLMVVAAEIQQERRGWWVDHDNALSPSYLDLIRLEATATNAQTYETHFVPGLLQTESYARAVPAAREPSSNDEVDRFVAIRMNRQAVLTQAEPMGLSVVISEAVLRQHLGGPRVFGDQLRHLLDIANQDHITLQVLPFTHQAHPGMTGAFTVLRLPSLDVAHVEMLNSDAYIEDERSVQQYLLAFERLSDLALSETDSVELITETIGKL